MVNFFYLLGLLASAKLSKKCASDTIIWILQRGAKVEYIGGGDLSWESCKGSQLVTK